MDHMLNQLVVGQPVRFHSFPYVYVSYGHQSQSKATGEMKVQFLDLWFSAVSYAAAGTRVLDTVFILLARLQ